MWWHYLFILHRLPPFIKLKFHNVGKQTLIKNKKYIKLPLLDGCREVLIGLSAISTPWYIYIRALECDQFGRTCAPNFSRVRLTKIPGRTGASSHSRKEKKSIRDSETLWFNKDTPVRLISWSKPIRDSEGRTLPLIGRGPDIPVCVCARWQMRHVCCCSQTERKRWVVEMRAVLPT